VKLVDKKAIVIYVSGHGFGHASRISEVIRTLLKRNPSLRIVVKTSGPEWFIREHVKADFEFHDLECDTGAAQPDSLNLDPLQTLKNYAQFSEKIPGIIEWELKFIRQVQAGIIIGDIPPLAFEIAARASLPSLAIANFSWDWIYEPYVEEFPEYRDLIPAIRGGYAKAGLLLRLPFSDDMSVFPRIKDIPLIARRSRKSAEEVRDRLGIDNRRPVILLSFGGFWLGRQYYEKLTEGDDFAWLASERVGRNLSGIINIGKEKLRQNDLGYPDLVKAADIVVTKPGYGIISECIANRTKMLYTSRGNFREYPVLVTGVKKYLPSRFISREKLESGNLRNDIIELLQAPDNYLPIDCNGADVCVRAVLSHRA